MITNVNKRRRTEVPSTSVSQDASTFYQRLGLDILSPSFSSQKFKETVAQASQRALHYSINQTSYKYPRTCAYQVSYKNLQASANQASHRVSQSSANQASHSVSQFSVDQASQRAQQASANQASHRVSQFSVDQASQRAQQASANQASHRVSQFSVDQASQRAQQASANQASHRVSQFSVDQASQRAQQASANQASHRVSQSSANQASHRTPQTSANHAIHRVTLSSAYHARDPQISAQQASHKTFSYQNAKSTHRSDQVGQQLAYVQGRQAHVVPSVNVHDRTDHGRTESTNLAASYKSLHDQPSYQNSSGYLGYHAIAINNGGSVHQTHPHGHQNQAVNGSGNHPHQSKSLAHLHQSTELRNIASTHHPQQKAPAHPQQKAKRREPQVKPINRYAPPDFVTLMYHPTPTLEDLGLTSYLDSPPSSPRALSPARESEQAVSVTQEIQSTVLPVHKSPPRVLPAWGPEPTNSVTLDAQNTKAVPTAQKTCSTVLPVHKSPPKVLPAWGPEPTNSAAHDAQNFGQADSAAKEAHSTVLPVHKSPPRVLPAWGPETTNSAAHDAQNFGQADSAATEARSSVLQVHNSPPRVLPAWGPEPTNSTAYDAQNTVSNAQRSQKRDAIARDINTCQMSISHLWERSNIVSQGSGSRQTATETHHSHLESGTSQVADTPNAASANLLKKNVKRQCPGSPKDGVPPAKIQKVSLENAAPISTADTHSKSVADLSSSKSATGYKAKMPKSETVVAASAGEPKTVAWNWSTLAKKYSIENPKSTNQHKKSGTCSKDHRNRSSSLTSDINLKSCNNLDLVYVTFNESQGHSSKQLCDQDSQESELAFKEMNDLFGGLSPFNCWSQCTTEDQRFS